MAIIARSTSFNSETLFKQANPCTWVSLGFTTNSSPLYPPSTIFLITLPPGLDKSFDPPTTTMLLGSISSLGIINQIIKNENKYN